MEDENYDKIKKEKKQSPLKNNQKSKNKKRSRIIIRNLSYKCNENNLRQYFEKYGNIIDLQLLKRPDGRLIGCAFIQYEKVNQAAKAILKCTNQEFLGRKIYVDWAIGQDKYKKVVPIKNEIKEKEGNNKEIKSTTVKLDECDENYKIKNESDEDFSERAEALESDSDDNDDDEDEDDEENEDKKFAKHKKIIKENDNDEVVLKKKRKMNNDDVKEGCTIFLKNVPFDATNDDIKELCQKYGPIVYALINIDPISGHSKGTAFVKFKTKESADLLLSTTNSGKNELILMDSIIEPHLALARDKIKEKLENKNSKTTTTDSRNLYLAKEGLIMAGSKAAEGVSASDMAKRHKLEKIKTQILKNLNRFVSRNRLSIHNLPLSYDDEKLCKMIIKHTKFKPHECRVMRENKPTLENPNGKSKGFGFMSFKTHEEALLALRKLNNNPNVFGTKNRPIVAFSIEDRTVHNIKQKRLQKSQQNNPTYKKKVEKGNNNNNKKEIKNQENNKNSKTKEIKTIKVDDKDNNENHYDDNIEEDFMGISAKPGQFLRMRSNKKIKEQFKVHTQNVTKLKRLEKRKKEKLIHLKEKRQQQKDNRIKVKKSKNNDNTDKFSFLVDKYKKLIDTKAASENLNENQIKKKKLKWYVE